MGRYQARGPSDKRDIVTNSGMKIVCGEKLRRMTRPMAPYCRLVLRSVVEVMDEADGDRDQQETDGIIRCEAGEGR